MKTCALTAPFFTRKVGFVNMKSCVVFRCHDILLELKVKSITVDVIKINYDFKTPQATSVPSATSAMMTTCNMRT